MSAPARLGLLGGSFNPVHRGHLRAGELALRHAGCQRVLLVPVASPPHKSPDGLATAEHRLAMLRLAVEGRPEFEVSTIEIDRGGVSYTVDTIEALRARLGPAGPKLTLIVGADMLPGLPRWREIDRVLELAALFVVGRPGSPRTVSPELERRFGEGFAHRLESAWAEHEGAESSTEIRRRCREGLPVDELVPPGVAEYLRTHRVYL